MHLSGEKEREVERERGEKENEGEREKDNENLRGHQGMFSKFAERTKVGGIVDNGWMATIGTGS